MQESKYPFEPWVSDDGTPRDYIVVYTHNIKNIEGKLLTLLESTSLPDRQLDSLKGTVRTLLWDWHDAIFNLVEPSASPADSIPEAEYDDGGEDRAMDSDEYDLIQKAREITHRRIFEARNAVRRLPDNGPQYSMLMGIATDAADDIVELVKENIK